MLARERWSAWIGLPLLLFLIALRLPSLVEPAGGDQGLYAYSGTRLLAGDVPYRDVWDQKPPGIAVLYAALIRVWPHESVVAAADLVAAAGVAWLLVLIGRRRFTEGVGYGAASLFLLFGHPSLQTRLSGVYVRGQCEPFMALAVTAGLALLAGRQIDANFSHSLVGPHPHSPALRRSRTRSPRAVLSLVLSGGLLAAAFWLKYNAAAYAIPFVIAAWAWGDAQEAHERRNLRADVAWMAAGFAGVGLVALIYFTASGTLVDLWLATVDYNVHYANETYASPLSRVLYLFTMPVSRAYADMLWFLGGVGTLALAWLGRRARWTVVPLGWLVAAIVSIAINGRDLTNYFIQANPALALAAAAGLALLFQQRGLIRSATAGLLVLALARVGDEPNQTWRFGGLPGLVDNVRFDLDYARGQIDRRTYLARFKGQQKFDALAIDDLSRDLAATTAPTDSVFVFGFLGGSVCWKSDRVSASRFFWSRPIIIEFAAGRPGYGSAGLVADLRRRAPAVVALQKEEWQSRAFFLGNDALRGWLEAGYARDRETDMFEVWRKK